MLGTMLERFRRTPDEPRSEYDAFEANFGERLDVESFMYIREMEDFFIDGHLMAESERQVVPGYLREEWEDRVGGPAEPLRPRDWD